MSAQLTPTTTFDEWEQSLFNRVHTNHHRGGYIFYLPDPRPDMASAMASRLGFEFVDYQQDIAMALGRNAYFLTLGKLNEILAQLCEQRGIVLYNLETLLCWKTPAERRDWLSHFLLMPWTHPIILTLVPCG